jgi:serine/threonine-protein kinase RsbW
MMKTPMWSDATDFVDSPSRSGKGGPWVCVSLRRADDVVPYLEGVTDALFHLGYPPRDVAGLRLALEEAIVNGLRHGNGGDPARRVVVCSSLRREEVLFEVEDEGAGFDPRQVPDPTAPENLGRPSGRGLLLMRHYTTWVRHLGRGNSVLLCKRRSPCR